MYYDFAIEAALAKGNAFGERLDDNDRELLEAMSPTNAPSAAKLTLADLDRRWGIEG